MSDFTRLKPCDLVEAQDLHPGDTIADLIADMQEGKIYDCPKCQVGGVPKGFIEIIPGDVATRTPCDVCLGYCKTELLYEAVESVTGYAPADPQPEP